jgi:hypothetical protein
MSALGAWRTNRSSVATIDVMLRADACYGNIVRGGCEERQAHRAAHEDDDQNGSMITARIPGQEKPWRIC